jgi:hypothetical protein
MIDLLFLIAISLILFFTFLIDKTALILPLLFVVWYIPRQTAPGAYLENYIILRWIILLLLPLLVLLFLLLLSVKRFKKVDFPVSVSWLLLFIFHVLISGFLNKVKLANLFGFLGLYITYFFIFIILANLNITEKNFKRFLFAFITLLLFQIPECFYRYFSLGITGDNLSWSLGPWGTTDLGVYMIYALSILISFWVTGFIKKLWQKLMVILLIIMFFALSVMGEIKAFIISAIIIGLIIFLKEKKFKPLPLLVIIMLILSSYTAWANVYAPEQNYLYMFILNLISFLKTGDLEIFIYSQGTSRIAAGVIVLGNIYQDLLHFLFGFGPGTSFKGTFIGEEGLLVKIGWILEDYVNQISAMLADTGTIGLFLYFTILFTFYKLIKKTMNFANDKFTYAIALATLGMWFFYTILSPWYILSWRLDSASFIFYVFLSFLCSSNKKGGL